MGSAEARELDLVGKVELKIALTQSESALQSILKTYLPPLLLKLESEHVSVRNKVISICQHINTRIKSPTFQLPVTALLKQFKDRQSNLVRHFDLIYVQQGVERLPTNERVELVPILLHGFERNFRDSTKHAATLFNLFLRLLRSMTLPERGSTDDSILRQKLWFSNEDKDATLLAEWVGKLILYPTLKADGKRCPALGVADCEFLQLFGKADTWVSGQGGLNLTETKIVALRFIASGAFVDEERFFPALFASADSNSRISDVGDDILKRVISAVSMEDDSIIQKLFTTYLGNRGADGSLSSRPALQIKILGILSRSKVASSHVPECLQIVQEGLVEGQLSGHHDLTKSSHKGREAAKLRGQIFAFINWVARVSSPTEMSRFAPNLVGHLRSYIEDQGWPRPRTEEPLSVGELASRSYSYESIGLLAAACPKELLLEPNVELLRWMMTSLSEDPSGGETSLSIDHALSSVISAFKRPLKAELEHSLVSLFLHHMNLSPDNTGDSGDGIVRSTRFLAVRFVNRCLSFGSTDARYLDVLALCSGGKERSEVLEEGKKGLHPFWNRMLNPGEDGSIVSTTILNPNDVDLPSFAPLVQRLLGSESNWDLSKPFMAHAFKTALGFCRCTLMHHALVLIGIKPTVDADWERHIDAIVHNNEVARAKLRVCFVEWLGENRGFSQAMTVYVRGCFELLTIQGVGESDSAGEHLVEICSFLPSYAYSGLCKDINRLRESIFSSNRKLRKNAAHAFGLLASLDECPKVAISTMQSAFDQRLRSWEQAIGSQVYEVHGSILAQAFYLSRSARRCKNTDKGQQSTLVANVVAVLSKSKDKLLLEATFEAIAELMLYELPVTIQQSLLSKDILQKLVEKGKQGDEKAVLALGRLAMQCPEEQAKDSTLALIIDQLWELHSVRQPEVQFSVGEALTCAAVGWDSKALIDVLDIDGPAPQSASRHDTISTVIERLFLDCKSTKPAMRQATVIWLLCIVQFCSHQEAVQDRLTQCQIAFKGFLADHETLNQESASRGLTLIYENGSRELKDDLIRDLVGSFTGTGSNLAGTVSEDTELFDPGALPTGDGSIRTYKDIMSLASEVGDSSLVYRFMSLASHDAIWSSRAAFGRFGLSNILSDASTDGWLAHNAKLYPALYRYRFDPNTNVRNAMNDIWTALVKDPAATIKAHFDAILKDLLKNILGKEWRTRQASCAAIGDLVQSRPLENYELYLSEIWSLTFKVCDDIKESVRAAAMSLARVLTGILTRSLEGGDSSVRTADSMLKQVLPFLLSTQGLESSADDVQAFSRKTVLQIIKKGQARTLRPFVPELVGRLLALLSSIEPEMINFLHMNAEEFGTTKQELDDARLKHIRGSTMLEAIEKCLDYLDEASMPELQDHLQDAIRTVVGLPSKVGCSRVLVSLSTRQNFIFKPYADNFLILARKQVFDRNDTISSAYATACGYLARLVSDDALSRLIRGCRQLYYESEDDRQRIISGDVIYAVSKYATDRFNGFAGEVYPFVFVAKHDQSARVKSSFQDTWNDNVGGSRAVLLYLKEIVQLISQHLDSPRWSIRHTSAYAIADVINSAGSSISDMDARTIWPALEKALSGKTWDGKEEILQAFINFVQRSNLAKNDPSIVSQTRKIMLRESKRNNPAYRQHAYKCLADFIKSHDTTDMFDEVHSIVSPIFEELLGDTEEMDIDPSKGNLSSKTLKEVTLANALSAVLRAVPAHHGTSDIWQTRLSRCLALLEKVNMPESRGRAIQMATYETLGPLFQSLASSIDEVSEALEEILMGYTTYVFDIQDEVEQVRLKGAEAAARMAPVAKKGDRLRVKFADDLKKRRVSERSSGVQQVLDRALETLEQNDDTLEH